MAIVAKLYRRVTYESFEDRQLPLSGMRLRRHVWAILLEKLACRVRGWHAMHWDEDWKEWFCNNCGKHFPLMPPPHPMDMGRPTPQNGSDTSP